MSVDYAKLRTNLNLIIHRLKLVEKKKVELNQKARRTIGDFLNAGKPDRARIRVEQIIRDDYIIESMDLVESYCDFLISRFGQLQASEVVDEGLATAVSSLIWVASRFENDLPELKVIADQLGRKYGKQYVAAVKDNSLKTVNETLIKKMGVQAPPKILVEKYLVEIAKDQKIDYKPDQRILKEQEVLDSSNFRPGASSDEDDDMRRRQSGQAPQGGFNLIDLGDHYPRNPITSSYSPYDQPPPLPSEPPLGPTPLGPSSTSLSEPADASAPSAQIPIGFVVSGLDATSSSTSTGGQSRNSTTSQEKSVTSRQEPGVSGPNGGAVNSGEGPPPNYDSVVNKPGNTTQYYSFAADTSDFAGHHQSRNDLDDTLPELPPVPKDTNDIAGSSSNTSIDQDKLDADELTRRFEELKNRKN